MKRLFVLGLLTISGFFCPVLAQSSSTRVERIEIDGKEVKKSYKVFFLSHGNWVESERTPTGFIIPSGLRYEEALTVLVTFGKYRLEFAEIHISKFATNWIIGVDKKPFSERYVKPEEADTIRRAYYIRFEGGVGLDTVLVVTEQEND